MTKELPSPEFLHKVLFCDFETGSLIWRERSPETFETSGPRPASDVATNWNARWANKPAFTSVDGPGYKKGLINGRAYKAAHVVWAMAYGEWPQETGFWLDHINNCRTDNRLENLRLVTPIQNAWNRRSSPGDIPVVGVSFDVATQLWRARITINGVRKHLGRFASFDAALSARLQAEQERWHGGR